MIGKRIPREIVPTYFPIWKITWLVFSGVDVPTPEEIKKCLSKEEYDKFSEAMRYGTHSATFNRIANMQSIIQLLGEANQIDDNYADPEKA